MLAAVVLDALGAPADPELDRVVGAGAAQRLRAELRAIARRWVAELAPGNAFEATSPAAAAVALHDHDGAVVLVAPDIPGLGPEHVRSVLDDLAQGTQLAVGSAHDARPYLVVLASADPDLIERAGDGWEALMGLASERGLTLAMLRPERRLVSPGDARALRLDPLAPVTLLDALGSSRTPDP
jgi:hypothetical protein